MERTPCSASLMTLSLSENYGAALQTYASAEAFRRLGASVTVYNYNDARRLTYGLSLPAKIKYRVWTALKHLLTLGKKARRYRSFRAKHIPMSKRYRNNAELRAAPGEYDVYVAGSDQIWNPALFLFDYSYLLDFVPTGKRKISYATSFGKAALGEGDRERMASLLRDFSALSVREESGKDILRELVGREAELCLDPTLLLRREDWEPVAADAKPRHPDFHGILCYIMPGDPAVEAAILEVAESLKKKTGLPILCLGMKEYKRFTSYRRNLCDIVAGPSEFIYYMLRAEYVVTNSFHGTAFSVNFGKRFYVPINTSRPPSRALHERILSFLKLVGAESALVRLGDGTITLAEPPEAGPMQERLEAAREHSYAYIENALWGDPS